jgi:hypothetical protein
LEQPVNNAPVIAVAKRILALLLLQHVMWQRRLTWSTTEKVG